jgi:hypothetical protein
METKDIQLWCILVDHEVNHIMGEAFIVDIPPEATVAEAAELKQRIMLHKSLIQFVNHNSLVVWKCPGLNVPGGDEDDDELVARIHRLNFSKKEEAQTLLPQRRVSSFSMPSDEILLVQMPQAGTYSHHDSTLLYSNDLPLP